MSTFMQPSRRAHPQLFAALALFALLVLRPTPSGASAAPDQPAYNGGSVMHSPATYTIFWLPAGSHFESSGNDASYESLIQRYLTDVGGSSYYNIVTQYADNANGAPANATTFGGSTVDTTAYPHAGTSADPLLDSDVQAAVSRAIAAKGWPVSANAQYFVFTALNIQTCLDTDLSQCAFAAFCSDHSFFLQSGVAVSYATMPAAASTNSGCMAMSGSGAQYAPNGDAAADSEIALASKEQFGMATDPQGDGWDDSSGAEIGDKCDMIYGTVNPDGSNVTLNGHEYIVQAQWSISDTACVLGFASSTMSVPVDPGWNLIDTPLAGSGSTVGALVTNMNTAGTMGSSAVTAAATYANGSFSVYVPGYSGDWSLGPAQGVFVLSTTAGSWTATGTHIGYNQAPVTLAPGWNLVAAPYPGSGLSTSTISSNAEAGPCGVQEIATYANGSYTTWLPGGTSFTISSTSGMWIACTSAYVWSPS